jgi:hypothetical protein
MMRQLVFVVDGIIIKLHKSNYTTHQADNMDKQLVNLYVNWNQMYIFSRKDEFTESDLEIFKVQYIIIKLIYCIFDGINILTYLYSIDTYN